MSIVLITGASSGIGRAAALALARAGHRVFATARRLGALEALAQEAGPKLEPLVVDVTRAESVAALREEILRRTGGHGVDVVVNNAGYGAVGPVLDISDEALQAQYDTNVFGLMRVTRAFTPEMIRRRSGRVVNLSSVGGLVTFPLMGVYNSTKYAVESLTDALRMELAPLGVHAVLIEPGPIRTEFNDVALGTAKVDPTSPWAAVLKRAAETSRRFEAQSVGPEHVVSAIVAAVESARPAPRYLRPWRTYGLLWLARTLPTRWADAIFMRFMGLSPDRVGVASTAGPVAALGDSRG